MNMTHAAMESLKKVSEITEASAARRTKMAADPKDTEAIMSAGNFFDEGKAASIRRRAMFSFSHARL